MPRNGVTLCAALLALALLGGCTGGVAVGQATPPRTRPLGEIAREERGEILTVRDTTIDLRTGQTRAVNARTPMIPVGPVGVRLPITVGGEKKVDAPAEEITVKLVSGRLISVVQELSSPPFAPGERVRVQHEKKDDATGVARIRVVRE